MAQSAAGETVTMLREVVPVHAGAVGCGKDAGGRVRSRLLQRHLGHGHHRLPVVAAEPPGGFFAAVDTAGGDQQPGGLTGGLVGFPRQVQVPMFPLQVEEDPLDQVDLIVGDLLEWKGVAAESEPILLPDEQLA